MKETTTQDDPYALTPDAIREPPHSLGRAFRQIGPGLILAASIVGTGELINTTGLGARRASPALADPAELRDQGLRPGGAGPVRDHARQDDARGVRHAARAAAAGARGSAGSG